MRQTTKTVGNMCDLCVSCMCGIVDRIFNTSVGQATGVVACRDLLTKCVWDNLVIKLVAHARQISD